jgi:hypothetical protein
VNLGVRRVRAQTLGTPSHEDARHEKKITIGSGSREDHWIHTWDRASEPHEKPEVLALGFASCEGPKSRQDKRPLKSQLTCASALRHIGCRELKNQGFDIASHEAAREVRPRTRE